MLTSSALVSLSREPSPDALWRLSIRAAPSVCWPGGSASSRTSLPADGPGPTAAALALFGVGMFSAVFATDVLALFASLDRWGVPEILSLCLLVDNFVFWHDPRSVGLSVLAAGKDFLLFNSSGSMPASCAFLAVALVTICAWKSVASFSLTLRLDLRRVSITVTSQPSDVSL